MKALVFEGIATSGKSTLINMLSLLLQEQGVAYEVVDENVTLMPLLDNTDQDRSIQHLTSIIQPSLEQQDKLILYDRLYFTHIFRTGSALRDYQSIESLLRNEAHLVMLKVNEEDIKQRVSEAMSHRGESWRLYVMNKASLADIEEYYLKQQQQLINLLQETQIPHSVYNVSELSYEAIAQEIYDIVMNRN